MSYTCNVAGTSFGDRQRYIRLSRVGDEAHLNREPENPYDSNAIAVFLERQIVRPFLNEVDVEQYGLQIGYIPKNLAKELALAMDCGARFKATIQNLVGGGSVANIGVKLHITLKGQPAHE